MRAVHHQAAKSITCEQIFYFAPHLMDTHHLAIGSMGSFVGDLWPPIEDEPRIQIGSRVACHRLVGGHAFLSLVIKS